MRPSPDQLKLMAQVGKQYPQFIELLDLFRQAELEAMAVTTPENFCTLKGRVQMLTNLLQQLRP